MDPQPQFNKCNSLPTTVYAFQWTWSLEMSQLVIISLSSIEQTTSHLCHASRAWQGKSLESKRVQWKPAVYDGHVRIYNLTVWMVKQFQMMSSLNLLQPLEIKKKMSAIIIGQRSNKITTIQKTVVFFFLVLISQKWMLLFLKRE